VPKTQKKFCKSPCHFFEHGWIGRIDTDKTNKKSVRILVIRIQKLFALKLPEGQKTQSAPFHG